MCRTSSVKARLPVSAMSKKSNSKKIKKRITCAKAGKASKTEAGTIKNDRRVDLSDGITQEVQVFLHFFFIDVAGFFSWPLFAFSE